MAGHKKRKKKKPPTISYSISGKRSLTMNCSSCSTILSELGKVCTLLKISSSSACTTPISRRRFSSMLTDASARSGSTSSAVLRSLNETNAPFRRLCRKPVARFLKYMLNNAVAMLLLRNNVAACAVVMGCVCVLAQ